MSSSPLRFSRMRHLSTAVALLGAAGGAVLVIMGLIGNAEESELWLITAGGALIGGGVTAFVLIRLALKVEANTSRLYSVTQELHDVINRLEETLSTLAGNSFLSDAVKSISNRPQEWEALRSAINEKVREEDFEAVFRLIDDLERHVGYQDEAERLRRETREQCTEALRNKLLAAIEHVNGLFQACQWQQAKHEIERLEKLMPTEQRVKELWDLLDQKRDQYKQSLLRDWNKAVSEGNVERGIELLKELDQYLTAEEARSTESTARELFKERLQQLGIQFQFAVKDKRWRDALAAGLQIIEEFPNSRMAGEIQERLAPLRERAGIPTDVEVTARSNQVAEAPDSSKS